MRSNSDSGLPADVTCAVRSVFNECLRPLVLTFEAPVNCSIRFLDLTLNFANKQACWCYEPRGKKPILPYSSAHSKLVKRSIIKLCFNNALLKSCPHFIHKSFSDQVTRLSDAGYPLHVLTAVAGSMLKKAKEVDCNTVEHVTHERKKVVVLPYLHNISHNLMKIAKRVGVDVVLSAPLKLSSLCARVNAGVRKPRGCNKKHREPFVSCVEGVVYSIPLTCGKEYVGQTGRCINDRLRENRYNVGNLALSGHLAAHCARCGCKPLFNCAHSLARNSDQLTREIIEAAEIKHRDAVSCPSIRLSEKEMLFLSRQPLV